MRRTRSITVRLAIVFLLLLLLVSLLGAFCMGSLGYFNDVTAHVRDGWLPSTGVLADLNNFTSDLRAAEGARLLPRQSGAETDSDALIDRLAWRVEVAQHDYERIPQHPAEAALYLEFAQRWSEYRATVQRVRVLARAGDLAAAVRLFGGASERAYTAASDALDRLTERSIADARDASTLEEQAYERARWLILATIAVTCLAVALAMAHVRRSISAPILHLTDRMHRLTANETDLAIAGTERQDEIGEMARAVMVFRANAIELMESRTGLEQQARMLRERLAEEQRLMQLQRNFISMASHEFRTPISLIDGHAQILQSLRIAGCEEALFERARKIRRATLRMTHLLENLIDSMRIIDDDVRLYFHPVSINLAELLHDACLLQREIAPQAQILEMSCPDTVTVRGDAQLLFQAIGNLLSNAIKYSPDGGLIQVSLISLPDAAVVAVRDHGVGVPAADRARLFERYFRGSNTGGIVGTGIGLYFVRTVAELHDGSVTFESEEGQGSTFWLRMPCSAEVAAGRRSQSASSVTSR